MKSKTIPTNIETNERIQQHQIAPPNSAKKHYPRGLSENRVRPIPLHHDFLD